LSGVILPNPASGRKRKGREARGEEEDGKDMKGVRRMGGGTSGEDRGTRRRLDGRR